MYQVFKISEHFYTEVFGFLFLCTYIGVKKSEGFIKNNTIQNVLITTMSDLSVQMKKNVNYYFDENGGICSGISKLEAGSKHFLSNYKIDTILCIGSSGYEFYRSRINKFNLGIEELSSSVSRSRQDFIVQTIHSILTESELKNPEKWFEYFLQNESYYASLVSQLQDHPSFMGKILNRFMDVQEQFCNELGFAKSYLYNLSDSKMVSMNQEVEWVLLESNSSISEIVSVLNSFGKVNLFVDMQGGSRTDAYILNSLLSIFSGEKNSCVVSKRIVNTDFEPCHLASRICDETLRYSISDLVSGMNTFLRYGKSNQICEYLEMNYTSELKENPRIQKILSLMQEIDMCLSCCDVYSFANAIAQMKTLFLEETIAKKDSLNSLFEVLESSIQKDYAILLNSTEKHFTLNLIRWALEKGFIQQAYTIVESKMPYQFVEDGVFYYGLGLGRNDVIELFAKDYSDDWKTDDMDHFFIRYTSMSFTRRLHSNRKDILRVNSLCTDMEKLDTLYKLYESICASRHIHNHALSADIEYSQAVKMVQSFIRTYEEILVLIQDKTPLPLHVTKQEVREVWLRNKNEQQVLNKQEQLAQRPGEAYLQQCLIDFREAYQNDNEMGLLKEIRKLAKSQDEQSKKFYTTLSGVFKEIKNMDKSWDTACLVPRTDKDFKHRYPLMRNYINSVKSNKDFDRNHIYSLFHNDGGSRWLERMIQRPDMVMSAFELDPKTEVKDKIEWKIS